MGSKAFSADDMRKRLLAPAARATIKTDAPPYIDFFLAQDASISSIYGYSRMLRSDYEVNVTEMMISYGSNDIPFATLGRDLNNLVNLNQREHRQAFTPLSRAIDAFITYRNGVNQLLPIWGNKDDRAKIALASEQAARSTVQAFRDIALHELLVLAGGDARASEHALTTGQSFTTLRKRYGVKLAPTNWEFDAWHAGLKQVMRSAVPQDDHSQAIARKIELLERLYANAKQTP